MHKEHEAGDGLKILIYVYVYIPWIHKCVIKTVGCRKIQKHIYKFTV